MSDELPNVCNNSANNLAILAAMRSIICDHHLSYYLAMYAVFNIPRIG